MIDEREAGDVWSEGRQAVPFEVGAAPSEDVAASRARGDAR